MDSRPRSPRRSLLGFWLQAALAIACLAWLVGTVGWRGGSDGPRGSRFLNFAALAVCLVGARGLSILRNHLLLRSEGLSLHLVATARPMIAQLARNWLPWLAPGADEGWRGLYSDWYSQSSEALKRFRGREALWAGDWINWAIEAFRNRKGRPLPSLPHAKGLALCIGAEHLLGCVAIFFALRAAGGGPISWAACFWVLPLARVAGGFTSRFAGIGPRELVLSWSLIPGDAGGGLALHAGAWLLAWHLIEVGWGLCILLRQDRPRKLAPLMGASPSISVVIPVLNEVGSLGETVRRARLVPEVAEVIVVDGGSQDGSQLAALSLGCRLYSCPPGRGGQLRVGAQRASGDVILLLHADTWLEPGAGKTILSCLQDPGVVAGGFWKRFRERCWMLSGSRVKCAFRVWIGGRIVGDMAMFVRADALKEIGGVPDMELMEDFELSRRLRRIGRIALADGQVTTSARRFLQRGVLCTYLRMWQVTTLYRLGRSPAELRRLYG